MYRHPHATQAEQIAHDALTSAYRNDGSSGIANSSSVAQVQGIFRPSEPGCTFAPASKQPRSPTPFPCEIAFQINLETTTHVIVIPQASPYGAIGDGRDNAAKVPIDSWRPAHRYPSTEDRFDPPGLAHLGAERPIFDPRHRNERPTRGDNNNRSTFDHRSIDQLNYNEVTGRNYNRSASANPTRHDNRARNESHGRNGSRTHNKSRARHNSRSQHGASTNDSAQRQRALTISGGPSIGDVQVRPLSADEFQVPLWALVLKQELQELRGTYEGLRGVIGTLANRLEPIAAPVRAQSVPGKDLISSVTEDLADLKNWYSLGDVGYGILNAIHQDTNV